jgi:HTH-type transcriptional regulator / antitoxin MqsA
MKTCFQCRGDLEERSIILDQRRDGELYVIEEVPAEVCTQCGETYLSAGVLKVVDEIIKNRTQAEKEVKVPVWKFKVA